MFCIVTDMAWARYRMRDTARLARIRTLRLSQEALRHDRPACRASGARALMAWSLGGGGGVSLYKLVYRDRTGRPGVATQHAKGYDTAQGVVTRTTARARHGSERATRRAAGACLAIQTLYCDRGACNTARGRD